jgi:hypothetical protein
MKYNLDDWDKALLLLRQKRNEIDRQIKIVKSSIEQKERQIINNKYKAVLARNLSIATKVLKNNRQISELAKNIGVNPTAARTYLHEHCFFANPRVYSSYFEPDTAEILLTSGFNYIGASKPTLKWLKDNASKFVKI